MIGYVTVGTNDFEKAMEFYDGLFAAMGIERLWHFGDSAAWGVSRAETQLMLTKPHNGEEATVGNGMMVALRVGDRDAVHAVHAKALELGGRDEGAPGPRGSHGFYGGYFRDLDGNKLNTYVPA